MHHESKVIDSIILEVSKHNAKKVVISVGELSEFTVEDIRKALEIRIPCEIVEEESLVDCTCGFMGRAKITERDSGLVLFECPQCGRVPEVLKGADILIKDILV